MFFKKDKEEKKEMDVLVKVRESSVTYEDVTYKIEEKDYDALSDEDKELINPYRVMEDSVSELEIFTSEKDEERAERLENVLYTYGTPIESHTVQESDEFPKETQIEGGWVSRYAK